MDSIVEAIVEYATELRYEDIPREVVEAAAQRLVDSLGCGIAGHDAPAAIYGLRLAPSETPKTNIGRVLGSESRTTADMAAFVNSSMIRYLDCNDTMTVGHPSDCLGAILGVAGARPTHGRELLKAMIVAYETMDRIGFAAGLRERGWDQGVTVSISTAAALGSLLGLSKEQVRHAVAICAASNLSTHAIRSGELSLWKGVATAYASRGAVFITLLAAEGMTGPSAPLEGRSGIAELITGPLSMRAFGTNHDDFATPKVRVKYWPVEYNIQAAVWTALELRSHVAPSELAKINIRTYRRAWHETGCEPEKWDPRTRETADHSMPYIFARVLVDGEISLESFRPEAYLDEAIRPLMKKISVEVDDELQSRWPAESLTRASAIDISGNTYECGGKNPLGHDKNPMSDDEIERKFVRLVEPVLGADRTTTALRYWRSVYDLADITPAFDAIAVE